MLESKTRSLLIEGLVIITSILLAFAIDAGWENRLEQERYLALNRALQADILETQQAIHERAQWAEQVAGRARHMLLLISNDADPDELTAALTDIGNVFVKGRWAPINHTYQQALGGGDLALVREAKLRLLLGRYTEKLSSFERLQESVITQYYGQLEPFMVANTNYSAVAWSGEAAGLVPVPHETDMTQLARSREFANLLNLKLELELEVISALEELLQLSDTLLKGLQSTL